MKNGKKSQSSIEYLLVYGFGVIAVAIAVVLAWQSGVFSQTVHTTGGSQGFSQVIVEDFSAHENSLNLSIKNDASDTIRITKINASFEYKYECTYENAVEITSGDKITLTLNCPNLREKYPSGRYYNANIDVRYINIRTNNQHDSLGTIWGTVE